MADVEVTVELLKRLPASEKMSAGMDIRALHDYCWSFIDIPVCPFKKHRGEKWEDVPGDYMQWLLSNIDDLDNDLEGSIRKKLADRGDV